MIYEEVTSGSRTRRTLTGAASVLSELKIDGPLAVGLALIAALVYLAHAAPKPMFSAISLLPDPAGTALRGGLDYLVLVTAPRREGLRWIEVGDPRLRKADKLQTTTR